MIQGEVIRDENITVENTIKQVLYCIGFRVSSSQQELTEYAFVLFKDVIMLTEKYISTTASNFSSRTQVNGRMNFGTRRMKYIKAFTHWVQDFYHISGLPSIVGLSGVTFKSQLDRASTRSNIRKSMENQTKSSADAASPRLLENEKQWKHWEETFVNYAISYIGANDVTISDVIRENEDPYINGEHPGLINKTVACAPLELGYFLWLTGCLFLI